MTILEAGPRVGLNGQDRDDVERRMMALLPNKYSGIKHVETKGRRKRVFRALQGERAVVLKTIRREDPKTARELAILKRFGLSEAYANNVSPAIDWYEDDEIAVIVEEEGGETLADFLENRSTLDSPGRLTADEYLDVISGVGRALQFSQRQGFVYRDIQPHNILIKETEQGLEARLIDFDSAKEDGEIEIKQMPTANWWTVRDPNLGYEFTGHDAKHTHESSLYSLGIIGFESINGQSPVMYDPQAGTGTDTYIGDSVLNDEIEIGKDRRNIRKHRKAIRRGLNKLSWNNEKVRGMLGKMTSLSSNKRYGSLDDFVKDVDKLREGGILKRLKRHWKAIAATTTLTGLVLGSFGLGVGYMSALQIAEDIRENSRYEVGSIWNGKGVELSSGLANLEVEAGPRGELRHYPEKGYVSLDSGEDLHLFIRSREGQGFVEWRQDKNEFRESQGFFESLYRNAIEKALGEDWDEKAAVPRLEGRVYIEGWPVQTRFVTRSGVDTEEKVNDFIIWSSSFDETDDYNEMGGGGSFTVPTLKMPEDDNFFNYTVTVELYGPAVSKNKWQEEGLERFEFDGTDKAIVRKSFNVNVGNSDVSRGIGYAKFEGWYSGYVSLENLVDLNSREYQIPRSGPVRYYASIPELGWENVRFNGSVNGLPDLKTEEVVTFQIAGFDIETGRVASYTTLPLFQKRIYQNPDDADDNIYWWDLGRPTREYSERLPGYRESLIKRVAELHESGELDRDDK